MSEPINLGASRADKKRSAMAWKPLELVRHLGTQWLAAPEHAPQKILILAVTEDADVHRWHIEWHAAQLTHLEQIALLAIAQQATLGDWDG